MAVRYLLDTNIVSLALKGLAPAAVVRLSSLPREHVAISIVTGMELEYGLATSPGTRHRDAVRRTMSRRATFTVLTLVLAVACADGGSTSAKREPVEAGGPSACKGLDEAACTANVDCRAAHGWIPEPGSFYGGDLSTRAYRGCRYVGPPGDLGQLWNGPCGTSLTCAYDPEGGTQCFEFPDTCIPLGWVRSHCTEPCPVAQGGLVQPDAGPRGAPQRGFTATIAAIPAVQRLRASSP